MNANVKDADSVSKDYLRLTDGVSSTTILVNKKTYVNHYGADGILKLNKKYWNYVIDNGCLEVVIPRLGSVNCSVGDILLAVEIATPGFYESDDNFDYPTIMDIEKTKIIKKYKVMAVRNNILYYDLNDNLDLLAKSFNWCLTPNGVINSVLAEYIASNKSLTLEQIKNKTGVALIHLEKV